ncbi:ZYRO0F03740p [Zygosaccharomyces rouxii]|uniref:ZYRO0F03740p n=1 Tax=Zygosaccharomyces rouxii (strain ATCC 2623 / CBS 732 / NBRC 1130 / NCYC 568 / NRRL Y-229) TaxID=559307 RepID=C5DXB7_ZYGRC|nr:uncharacterized protein ZYRO0F03740g [Zygosaccharomyces rouxii]KAH9199191.1 hypothetical protein LQ764DRAFT_179970 [Zygosaccharomyces rouxii]CAR28428.1 ZYRO0F03740p [Zygosaccharomyces rouxii]
MIKALIQDGYTCTSNNHIAKDCDSKAMTMGKVYDPVHDVFQDQADADMKPGLEDSDSKAPAAGGNVSDGRIVGEEVNAESGDDSTESEDNTNILSNFGPSMVPSVTTNKKKMKESSKYNRHLKKPDGEFFSRGDLQFCFLRELLADERKLFRNIYKDVFAKSIVPVPPPIPGKTLNVTDPEYDAKTFVFDDHLTFSQLYVLTLASSTKCSKVLRDKLLFDQQVAFSTCILGILVNIGRLNTTINFYLEMTSQLRTFHSVPCLQYHSTDSKSLQDTPRLKSILKSLPVGNKPLDLSRMYETPEASKTVEDPLNLVNLLFTMCDNVTLVNLKLIHRWVETRGEPISLFNILDCPGYEPKDRCNVILWLIYIHLETDMSEESVANAVKVFTPNERIPLEPTDKDYDEDPQDEYQFGLDQKAKRKVFLQRIRSGEMPLQQEGHEQGEQESQQTQSQTHAQTHAQASSKKQQRDLKSPTMETVKSESQLPETAASTEVQDAQGELQEPTQDPSDENTAPNNTSDTKQDTTKRRKPRPRKRPNSASNVKKESKAPAPKRRKTEPPEDRRNHNDQPESEDRIDQMISADKAKLVGIPNGESKTQDQFITDLRNAHMPVANKRHDLGLVKIFSEYEDIPMASVIGIRGKKRRKFRDGMLGFETDYLRNFAAAKKIMLHKDPKNYLFEPFHL